MSFIHCIFFLTISLLLCGDATAQNTKGGQVCNCGVENEPRRVRRGSDYISGGDYTYPNQYPWMVLLRGGTCGGTLISDRHVLTAHHCIVEPPWFETVKVSVHDRWDIWDYQELPVKDAVFPTDIDDHDIAILILAEPVKFDRDIQPVCLPSKDFVYVGKETRAMGWGMTHFGNEGSQTLKHVNLTVYDAPAGSNFFYTNVENINGVYQDPCTGDSGGPLVHQDPTSKRWTIIGTLYGGGYNCRSDTLNGKGSWNKVTDHLDWINKVLAEDSSTERCA